MSRGRPIALRSVLVALLTIGALGGSLRVYTKHEAHRATSLLAETSRIHIGDAEEAELRLIQRNGGYRWTPEPLLARENWIDKDEYDYQQSLRSDYKYELEISPFGTTAHQELGQVYRAMQAVREAVPLRLRSVLGMRDWGTVVELSIRKGRVQSVSAMTLVEGRSQWLGHKWELAEGMPRHDMRPIAYAIGEANLTMGISFGFGTMIENYVTPKASPQQTEAARNFNHACLTSIRGCDGLCDFAPLAINYLEQNPGAAWNIIPPKCQ